MLQSPLFRYIAPFAALLLFSFPQGMVDVSALWLAYSVKILAVAVLIIALFRGHWQEINGGFDWRAVGVGLGVLVLWIGNYHLLYDATDPATPYDTSFHYFVVRALGSSLVIPLVEELFFRSFFMRYLVQNNFLSVQLGRYTAFSFWGTAVFFALMHPAWQWGAALAAGAAYGAYLVKTKNLVGCIVAHATTNAGIALYVFLTGEWALWK